VVLTTANFGRFSNFCRYYTRSQAGKGTGYRPTLKPLGLWFSPGSSINKTDRHDITEILLKVALNTITLILTFEWMFVFTKCFYLHVFCFFLLILVLKAHKSLSYCVIFFHNALNLNYPCMLLSMHKHRWTLFLLIVTSSPICDVKSK
jgi:hypothetical protein